MNDYTQGFYAGYMNKQADNVDTLSPREENMMNMTLPVLQGADAVKKAGKGLYEGAGKTWANISLPTIGGGAAGAGLGAAAGVAGGGLVGAVVAAYKDWKQTGKKDKITFKDYLRHMGLGAGVGGAAGMIGGGLAGGAAGANLGLHAENEEKQAGLPVLPYYRNRTPLLDDLKSRAKGMLPKDKGSFDSSGRFQPAHKNYKTLLETLLSTGKYIYRKTPPDSKSGGKGVTTIIPRDTLKK